VKHDHALTDPYPLKLFMSFDATVTTRVSDASFFPVTNDFCYKQKSLQKFRKLSSEARFRLGREQQVQARTNQAKEIFVAEMKES